MQDDARCGKVKNWNLTWQTHSYHPLLPPQGDDRPTSTGCRWLGYGLDIRVTAVQFPAAAWYLGPSLLQGVHSGSSAQSAACSAGSVSAFPAGRSAGTDDHPLLSSAETEWNFNFTSPHAFMRAQAHLLIPLISSLKNNIIPSHVIYDRSVSYDELQRIGKQTVVAYLRHSQWPRRNWGNSRTFTSDSLRKISRYKPSGAA